MENEAGEMVTKLRTEIPIAKFAEAIMGGAELPPVKDEDTELVFNPKDKWDFRRLKPVGTIAPKDNPKDDMPF